MQRDETLTGIRSLVAAAMMLLLFFATRSALAAAPPVASRPNVLIWIMDDVGFGHPSPFGGPVDMPTLQSIAERGLRFTNFHSTAICSPSRAALLNGRNHHALGMGNHAGLVSGDPGYTARIPRTAASLATILRQQGYSTWALGKWDQFPNEDATPDGPYDYWPSGQGFERFYGFLFADMDHFHPTLWRDHTPIDAPRDPKYFLTTDLANQAIQYLRDQQAADSSKPFFLYWATGVAHSPHHAPQEWLDRYKGKFDHGWDEQRERTLAAQKRLGIMAKNVLLPARQPHVPAWSAMSPSEHRFAARTMEAFAASLSHADQEFGRIVDELRRQGRLDDTMIIVVSDNGASGEGGPGGSYNEWRSISGLWPSLEENLEHYDEWGGPTTYPHYSIGWAMAGNTPFKHYKTTVHAGGVRGPTIISWPAGIKARGEVRGQFHHLIDVMPTVLEAAQIQAPAVVDGVTQQPIEGTSLLYAMRDGSAAPRRTQQYFEIFGNRAIVADGWKAVVLHRPITWNFFQQSSFDNDVWELYHVDQDPNELNDLARREPAKLASLQALFDAEARRNNVYPLVPDVMKYRREQVAKQLASRHGQFNYSGVVRGISNDAAPPTYRMPYVLRATFDAAGSDTRVLVAHGGAMGGYSLYLRDGVPVYCYNLLGGEKTFVRGNAPLGAGRHELTTQFQPDAQGGATVTLSIDGTASTQGKVPKLTPMMYEASDGFSVGLDQGSSVSPETAGVAAADVAALRIEVAAATATSP
jgi:arylsulfatase A-like enzyme